MEIKSVIVGLLLAAALLLVSMGLKKTKTGLAFTVPELAATLLHPAAGFGIFVLLLAALLALPGGVAQKPLSGMGPYFMVTALNGPLSGKSYYICASDGELSFGRERCHVRFPASTPGVSRHHCSLSVQGAELYLKDTGSQYGTFVQGSVAQRLSPHSPVILQDNSCFFLADRSIMFRVNRLSHSSEHMNNYN